MMNVTSRRIFVCCLCLLVFQLIQVGLFAQEGSPVIRIQSEMVLVDLLAFDEKSGEFISDLKEDEIEIRADGKTQKVEFFELADFSTMNRTTENHRLLPASNSTRDLRRPNPIILVIDLNNFEGGDLNFTQEAIRTFFSGYEFSESNLFMLFAIHDRLTLMSDLTNNTAEITELVNSLRGSASSLSYKNLIEKIGNTFRLLIPAGFRQQAMEQAITDAKLFKMDVRDRIKSTTKALMELADYLEPIPGRKSLVFVSRGYPTNSGNVVYEIISGYNNGIYAPTLMSAKLGPSSDDQTLSDIQKCTRMLNGSQIALYGFDVKGVDPEGLANSSEAAYIPQSLINRFNNEDQVAGKAMFDRLTETTTGETFSRSTAQAGLKNAVRESQRYYLLGFQTKSKKKEGQYTDIELRVSRPNTSIRYRQGFIHSKIEDLEEKVIKTAVQFPKFYQDFPLQTEVQSVSGGEVTIGFNVPTKDLQFERKGDKFSCTIGVYGILTDLQGKWTTQGKKYTFAKEFPLNLSETALNGLRTVGAPIQFKSDLGTYQLTVVVRQLPGGLLATSTESIEIQ